MVIHRIEAIRFHIPQRLEQGSNLGGSYLFSDPSGPIVSAGIEEPDKVRGKEHLTGCFARGRSALTYFFANESLR
jgi:hypothetical protein